MHVFIFNKPWKSCIFIRSESCESQVFIFVESFKSHIFVSESCQSHEASESHILVLMSHLSHIYLYISSYVSRFFPPLVSHVSHDFVHSELCDPETAVLSRSTDISWVKNSQHGVISQKTLSQETVSHYYSRIIKKTGQTLIMIIYTSC